jgi:enoyl-CoA hydratase
LFPDVGGSYFLPRCPGETGLYLALTGARLKAADLLQAGIATAVTASANRDPLVSMLADGAGLDETLRTFCGGAGPDAPLSARRAEIDRCFSAGSAEAILERLDAEGSAWAHETAQTIRAKSPTATKLAYRQVREGRHLGFEDCMRMEYRMVNRVIAGHDFYEGVRATIIDKDQSPKWSPACLEDVSEADIDAYFAPLGEKELQL